MVSIFAYRQEGIIHVPWLAWESSQVRKEYLLRCGTFQLAFGSDGCTYALREQSQRKREKKASVFNSIHEAIAVFGISSHVWDSVRTHLEGINYPKLILLGPRTDSTNGEIISNKHQR